MQDLAPFALLLIVCLVVIPRGVAEAGSPVLLQVGSTDGQAITDLETLGHRLQKTKAVGIFTKLSFKSNADKLHKDLRAYHQGD